MPIFSIIPTGIRPHYKDFNFEWYNDPFVHVKNFEIISPKDFNFTPGDIIKLSASQNRYSFDYYEIWAPNIIINSECHFFQTIWGFYASFDPNTEVQLNDINDISGSNATIIARYR